MIYDYKNTNNSYPNYLVLSSGISQDLKKRCDMVGPAMFLGLKIIEYLGDNKKLVHVF